MKKMLLVIITFLISLTLFGCENIDLGILNGVPGLNNKEVVDYTERSFYEYAIEYGYEGTYEEFDSLIRNGIEDATANVSSYQVIRTVRNTNIIQVTFTDGSTSTISLSSEKKNIDSDKRTNVTTNNNKTTTVNTNTETRTYKKFTVSFEYPNGIIETVNVATFSGDYVYPPYNPTKEGCVFTGWWSTKRGGYVNDFYFTTGDTLVAMFNSGQGNQNDNYEYHIENECVYITNYIGTEYDFSIPERIDGYEVVALCEKAFYGKNIGCITIPYTVKFVGEYCFASSTAYCIDFMEGDDRFVEIQNNAFSNCEVLDKLMLPRGLTSLEGIFENSPKLHAVRMYNNITYIPDYLFNGCFNLEYIEFCGYKSEWNNISKGTNWYTNSGIQYISCSDDTIVLNNTFSFTYEHLYSDSWEIRLTSFNGSASVIVIPEMIDGYLVTEIGPHLFDGATYLNEVYLSGSANRICEYAFYNCSNLKKIEIYGNMCSIDSYAFANCPSLEIYYHGDKEQWNNAINKETTWNKNSNINVKYENSFTYKFISNTEIRITKYTGFGNYVSVPEYIDGYMVTEIGSNAFAYLDYIYEVHLPQPIVTICESAFIGSTYLRYVSIWSNVNRIGAYAFADCMSLNTIYYNGTKTGWDNINKEESWNDNSSNINMYYEINFDYEYSTTYGGIKVTKYNGTNSYVPIPSYIDNQPVTEIGNSIFRDLEFINEVYIPETVFSIGSYAFYNCPNLWAVNMESATNIQYIGSYAFANCPNLNTIRYYLSLQAWENIPKGNNWNKNSNNIVIYSPMAFSYDVINNNEARITGFNGYEDLVDIPEYIDGYLVTEIGDYAFANKTYSNAFIPDTVNKIGNHAFDNCYKLNYIRIGFGVTSIGSYAFKDIPEYLTIEYNGTNSDWEAIEKGTNWDIGLSYYVNTIQPYTYNINGNNEIEITDYNGPNRNVEIPEYIDGYKVTSIGANAFRNKIIEKIHMPNTITSLGSKAFYGCRNLYEVYLSENIIEIPTYCFRNCTSLNYVYLGENVKKIDNYAFMNCSNLLKIEIPNSLSYIGSNVFSASGLLLEFNGTEEEWNNIEKMTAIPSDITIIFTVGQDQERNKVLLNDCTNTSLFYGVDCNYSLLDNHVAITGSGTNLYIVFSISNNNYFSYEDLKNKYDYIEFKATSNFNGDIATAIGLSLTVGENTFKLPTSSLDQLINVGYVSYEPTYGLLSIKLVKMYSNQTIIFIEVYGIEKENSNLKNIMNLKPIVYGTTHTIENVNVYTSDESTLIAPTTFDGGWYGSFNKLKYTLTDKLEVGKKYALILEAKADQARDIKINLSGNYWPNNEAIVKEIISLKNEYNKYKIEFTYTGKTPTDKDVSVVELEIQIGWDGAFAGTLTTNNYIYIKSFDLYKEVEEENLEKIFNPEGKGVDVLQDFETGANQSVDIWFFSGSDNSAEHAVSGKSFHIVRDSASWLALPVMVKLNNNVLTTADWARYEYYMLYVYADSACTFTLFNHVFSLSAGENILTITKAEMDVQLNAGCYNTANGWLLFQINGDNISLYLDQFIGVYSK